MKIPTAFQDGAYEYKNYAVTFNNLHNQESEILVKWKIVGDSTSLEGNWKAKMEELKSEGWEVSRAVPGKWDSIKDFTLIYELKKLKVKDLTKAQEKSKR